MSRVLVVVDVQNGFVTDSSRAVVPAVVDLVRRWTGPVLFTRYRNHPGSPYERLLGWTAMQGPPSTDLVPSLEPYARRAFVLDKAVYSLFTARGRALVAAQGWTDLVFCGIATDSCVLKSAVDAFEAGLTPWVVTDACASDHSPEAHAAGLLCLRVMLGAGQLVTAADVA